MRNLTMITDDLTGAADSGGYFVERGCCLTIYTEWQGILSRNGKEIVALNLSSRNTDGQTAKRRHREAVKQVQPLGEQTIFKKIGTGFRGNDAYELEGLLEALPDYVCFLVDNAPDLGTFTLYGNQYCEGQILHKSLYANDPIMPPTKAYIPEILREHTTFPIGLVEIDAVKRGEVLQRTQSLLRKGNRVIVFDAITRADTLTILDALFEAYPQTIWTGSLGIAQGLAEMLYGSESPYTPEKRAIKSICFSASAYEMTKKQIERSRQKGLTVIELEMDAVAAGDIQAGARAVKACLSANAMGNFILVPKANRCIGSPGLSEKILIEMGRCAAAVCAEASFDRIAVIGGETAQTIFRTLSVGRLALRGKPEPGIAEGIVLDGVIAGKEFALKGGSIGSEDALEKMLCKSNTKEGDKCSHL